MTIEIRQDDCLTLAVGKWFDAEDVPYCTPTTDWEGGYRKLWEWALARGWYLYYASAESQPFDKYMAGWGEAKYKWVASVSHPSWQRNPDEAHAILMQGGEILYDPADDVRERPPLNEITLLGGFYVLPLDPSIMKETR